MSQQQHDDTAWHDYNQRYLVAALAVVREAIERHDAGPQEIPAQTAPAAPAPPEPVAADERPPALIALCAAFGLSPFERDLLLLAAGPELDARFAAALATQSSAAHGMPTFGLALACLPAAHWSALAPAAPLRRWHLLEVRQAETLVGSPLRIDERVLHYLAGVSGLDERLRNLAAPVPAPPDLPPSHLFVADRIVDVWSRAAETQSRPLVELCGEAAAGKEAIAAHACARWNLPLFVMDGAEISAVERSLLARLWERELLLGEGALLLDCDQLAGADGGQALRAFLASIETPVLVSAREPLALLRRQSVRLDVGQPSADEQRHLWQRSLGEVAARLNGQLDPIVAQFSLAPSDIEAVAGNVSVGLAKWGDQQAGKLLWEACRARARGRLGELAQRIESRAGWEDLILPEAQCSMLRQIAAQVRQRLRVYEEWGFAAPGGRGLGISVLFSGPSGTGKTLAADVLASALHLDLYRIDLSQVVSKYIGETEKNLRRVFDAAEESGAILLFDEADALFGKRSEVKDSHDRYANVEVSYLLQRMEAYRGLAILTTNMKNALDPAFLRRLRFVVQFPFPEAAQREAIWRRIFPAEMPREGLDWAKLARLNVVGGNIRSIALNAAFLAAEEGEPVRMRHLLTTTRSEFAKLERPLTEAEIGGWV